MSPDVESGRFLILFFILKENLIENKLSLHPKDSPRYLLAKYNKTAYIPDAVRVNRFIQQVVDILRFYPAGF